MGKEKKTIKEGQKKREKRKRGTGRMK